MSHLLILLGELACTCNPWLLDFFQFKGGSHTVGGKCNKIILKTIGDYWDDFSLYNMISEVDGLQTWKYKVGKYSLDTPEREITTILRIDKNGNATPVESIIKDMEDMTLIILKAITFTGLKPPAILFDVDIVCPRM